MKRVENNDDWTLMCPNECPGLSECWGEKFEELYTKYERENKGRVKIKAQKLWNAIIESQIETGTPYMVYKDHCNRKSNQQNLGTIKSSNLCTEIIQYTSPNEIAVCNLASIGLSKFVKVDNTFDYESLLKVTKVITKNLNNVIDLNYYPVNEARVSNMKHRPIGIGVQGLADTFMKMKINYESKEALEINEKIFETIYFGALTMSNELAEIKCPYETFPGSPLSKGILQFDMWKKDVKSSNYDWDGLRKKIIEKGVRNSLLVAPMPTASTSQILGNNESFEPYTSNLYIRRVLAGEFICINPHLVEDLIKCGLWKSSVKTQIMSNNGSVQKIKEIPDDLKKLYKTVWEISQKSMINLAISRAPFIDQSQSLNIYLTDCSTAKITTMHFYGWKNGLKTGMYYLRSQPAVDAIKFTLNVEELLKATDGNDTDKVLKVLSSNPAEIKQEVVVKEIKKKDKEDEICISCQG